MTAAQLTGCCLLSASSNRIPMRIDARARRVMVPSRRGRLRRWARGLFRALLALGFALQSGEFVRLFLQFPATVELEVSQPAHIHLPAITVCNINEIRSSVYCEQYPAECGEPGSYPGFCTRYPVYCKLVNESRQVPLHNESAYRRLSRGEQQRLGHQFGDLVRRCTLEEDDRVRNCSSEVQLVPALGHSYELPFNCFMLYSLRGKPTQQPERVSVSTRIRLELDLEVSEYHPAHLSRGAQLALHSPYHVPSPVAEGLLLNMATVYRIYVRLAVKELLPAPYKSNCTDYERAWRENGGHGPVTQKMCKEECRLRISKERWGCVDRRVDYPHNDTLCAEAHPELSESVSFCSQQCSAPCLIRRYELQVQEANSEGTRKSCMHEKDLSCATLVHIIFENLEVTTFKYTPRYEAVGILSYIGGYVGLWLGISLLTVYDFLETRFFRALGALRMRKRARVSPPQ